MKLSPLTLATTLALISTQGLAHYPEASDPKLGAKLMAEVRQKLNIRYPRGSKQGTKSYQQKLNLCRADEAHYTQIQTSLLNPLTEALVQDQKSFAKWFTTKAIIDPLTSPSLTPTIDRDGLKVFQWQRNQIEPLLPTTGLSALESYLGLYTNIESVDFDAFDFYVDDTWRGSSSSYEQAKVFGELRVRGTAKSGFRMSDKLSVVMEVVQEKDSWRVSALHLVEGERVASQRTQAFRDESQVAGLDQVPTYLRREAIRRGGYSLSVADANSDGIPDLFVGTGGPSALFLGENHKTTAHFRPLNGEGTPQGEFVKSSVFADFDNDGDQDAVLVRFAVDHEHDDELVFYRNIGKGQYRYEPLLNKASVDKRWAMPAAVGDFNADSFLDLYVGYPGKKDFTTRGQPGLEFNGNKVLPHGMFFNNKGGAFQNVTRETLRPALEGAGYLFPHSALAFDYDHNRTTDLIVIDDRNNLSPMYRNNGSSFDQVAKKIGLGNSGYGMSVAVGDYNSDGLIDIAMTNVNLVAEVRFRNSCDRNWNIKPDDYEPGLRLFKNEGSGRFTEVTQEANFGWPGAATAGVLFVDYNNDGHEDLYVANGLWSGNRPGNELDGLWASANIKNDVLNNSLKYQTNGTQSLVMNLLIHFQGQAVDGKTIPGEHPSLGGFQRNKLYRNNGNGTFTEVAYVEGVDSIADGYGVVALDTDNDGRQELLLRNADPGTDKNRFAPVQLFKNTLQNQNQALTLTFTGSDSNRDAIGTEVIAEVLGKKTVRQLIANNGPQQGQRMLHFGLGETSKADLTIKWPNGVTEVKKGVEAGTHHYLEPAQKISVGQAP